MQSPGMASLFFTALLLISPFYSRTVVKPVDEGIDPALQGDIELDENLPEDTGLFYNDYLMKVMKALETDESFREQLLKYDFEQIKNGDVRINLNKVSDEMRLHLDETKRKEVERIRHLIRAQQDLEDGRRITKNNMKAYLNDIAAHFDHAAPHSFTEDDVIKLISSAAKDMDDFDQDRHDRFKKYEMHRKIQEENRMKSMTDEEKNAELERQREQRKKHNDHEPVNHPGSKKQMEEIWNEQDEMKDEEFDPKTFFMIHDRNSDKMLDVYEVELLMENELKKVYDENNQAEDDMVEMEEEKLRMREHFMKEVDVNKDKMVSLKEFMDYTTTKEFDKPDMNSYETVDQAKDRGHIYTKEELEEYKSIIDEHEQELKNKIEEMKTMSKEIMEDRRDINKDKLDASKDQTIDTPDFQSQLASREQELADRQKVLQDMANEVQEMAKDLTQMKNDYASSLINTDEYQDKIKELEKKQQEKLKEAEAKLDNLKQDEKVKLKMEEFERKKKEMDAKFEQLKHQL